MFFIKIPFFDLDKTYQTNLTSWYRVREGKYVVTDGDKIVTVEQGYKENFGFSCSEEDFYNHWYKYFGVDIDYLSQNYSVRFMGKSLKRVGVRASGIRIPQQHFITVLVREIFGEKFEPIVAECFTLIFRQAVGKKRKNTVRESGVYTWYEMPSDETKILNKYKKVVEIFKENATKENKKAIIWCLKKIKTILKEMVWYNLDEMSLQDKIDMFVTNGLSYNTAQWICIRCFGAYKLFIIDDDIEKAIKDVDDWEEYDDAEDFAQWMLIDDKQKLSAYLNLMLRWDMESPPKPGDETLWE